MNQTPKTCCAASRNNTVELISTNEPLMIQGPREFLEQFKSNLVFIEGGEFLMGTDSKDGFPSDGEGPVRKVKVNGFFISPFTVTNADFKTFVELTGYITEAERFGWSYVFHLLASEEVKVNGYGLYNMSGNVWEWCSDWFSPRYHLETSHDNPTYTIPTGNRSMRGGSFLCHRSYCNRYRVAARSSNTPDSSTNHCGFRVVADILS